MSKFCDRLKEERMRLGLSQTAFAKKVGIHRNTQIKYESGERHPDSEYFDLIDEIGVDVIYTFSGIRSEEKDAYDIAAIDLERGVYRVLGFSQEEIKKKTLELARLVDLELLPGGCWDTDEWNAKVDIFVNNLLSHISIDVDLLRNVIEGVETASLKLNTRLVPAKKAQAVAMLYRTFKASGRMDHKTIDETISLVAE